MALHPLCESKTGFSLLMFIEVRLVHPSKGHTPSVVRLDGIDNDFRLVQKAKALSPTVSIPVGKLAEVRPLQP